MTEAEIQYEILRVVGSRPDCRLWRNNTGAAQLRGGFVRFGLTGQADLSGILSGGRRLEIEVKSERGVVSGPQTQFGAMITKFGGLYVVARSLDDAINAIEGHNV